MEIKNTTNNFFDPYAAGLDKSTEARNDTRLKARADGTGTEASQGDTVTVSQDALLLMGFGPRLPESVRGVHTRLYA